MRIVGRESYASVSRLQRHLADVGENPTRGSRTARPLCLSPKQGWQHAVSHGEPVSLTEAGVDPWSFFTEMKDSHRSNPCPQARIQSSRRFSRAVPPLKKAYPYGSKPTGSNGRKSTASLSDIHRA